MPRFLITQKFYVEADNVLEAQTRLEVSSIVETHIERLTDPEDSSDRTNLHSVQASES